MKSWFNTRMYVSFGLCGVTLSLLLAAGYFGLIPDRIAALRQSRATLAEVVAASSTALITAGDVKALDAMLKLVVERNPDVESAAVRRADGVLVVGVGEVTQADDDHGQYSVERRVKVPILAANARWGQLEVGFKPVDAGGIMGYFQHPWVQLFGSLFIAGFIAYYVYLGRVLRQLDPSQAVPARVRSALDSLAEGLLVIDRKGYVVLANSAFAAVVGLAPERLVGRKVRELAWQDAQGRPLAVEAQPWRQALASGDHVDHVILNLPDAQGRMRTFIANCAPIVGGSRPNGVLISLDDVTQLEEKKVELARAKDEAEAANRAKSTFLANMSHEIRTPMNAILGFTEVLRRGYGIGEPNAQKYLATIHSSGRHLLDLINDILDLSKVESGHLEVECVECDPCEVVREVLDVLMVRAREKHIGLVFEPLGDLPTTVRSDPARLRQIVTNLVGNAIKFTELGEVKVAMNLLENGEFPQLTISVRDTGIGIAVEKLGAIFEPFVQADASVARRFGGTGLGLSISRRFARALGGNLQATSVPGQGSVFALTVPVGSLAGVRMLSPAQIMSRSDTVISAASREQWRFHDRRVLVVDDGPENRELVRLVLEECGIAVDEAEDGIAGVEKALAGKYDAVMMDIQMPRLDGIAATRRLREHGYKAPVLALTAHAMKGFEEEMKAAGYDHWLVKPVDIDAMLALLAELLGAERTGMTESASRVEAANEPAQQPTAAMDGPPIHSRYEHKTRFLPALRKFVDRLPTQIEAMQAAIENGDFQALAELAHGLKGAGGTVGFDAFTEPAAELDRAARRAELEAARIHLARVCDLAGRVVVPDAAQSAQVAA